MAKHCDNKSVGVIIRDGERFLIIKRKNYPVAFACVAGHLDGDAPLQAAMKEMGEEAGLFLPAERFTERVAHMMFDNPCKRDGGTKHEWFVYEVDAPEAMPKAGSDAKEVLWVEFSELTALIKRTEAIAEKHGVRIEDLANSTPAITADPEWSENPGIEPVWAVLFRHLKVL